MNGPIIAFLQRFGLILNVLQSHADRTFVSCEQKEKDSLRLVEYKLYWVVVIFVWHGPMIPTCLKLTFRSQTMESCLLNTNLMLLLGRYFHVESKMSWL